MILTQGFQEEKYNPAIIAKTWRSAEVSKSASLEREIQSGASSKNCASESDLSIVGPLGDRGFLKCDPTTGKEWTIDCNSNTFCTMMLFANLPPKVNTLDWDRQTTVWFKKAGPKRLGDYATGYLLSCLNGFAEIRNSVYITKSELNPISQVHTYSLIKFIPAVTEAVRVVTTILYFCTTEMENKLSSKVNGLCPLTEAIFLQYQKGRDAQRDGFTEVYQPTPVLKEFIFGIWEMASLSSRELTAPPNLVLLANLHPLQSCVQALYEDVEENWAMEGALQNPTSDQSSA
ncbi:hypothetical protein BTVI_102122 [Pitangus sulphuratus]|nr:hypothetical protein BTVI_102122 [Pitangus sulphuratus]